MMRCFLIIFLLLASIPAQADLKYYPDPVYKKLNAEDHHPMDDMLDLAKQGDVRAQFILGDMYAKGKGGLPRDFTEAKRWFEESAMHGYGQSFIRLAALAKREKNPIEAWQWYTLAIDALEGDFRKVAIDARRELTEQAELSDEHIKEARQAIRDWKDMQGDRLRAERDAAREKEKQEKERQEANAVKEQTEQQPSVEKNDE